ncbi:MAG: cellulase family glycosylhydrolase [Acidimicrobiales bacterium]|nr:cellulase family glycosylhydrolase [Acidimicrobiales bacterium]
MKSLRRFAAVAVALAATVSLVSAAPAESLTVSGQYIPVGKSPMFSVEGVNVLGPKGNKTTLRGIAKNGLEYSPKGYQEELWNYERMKSWGVNIVRIPLATTYGVKAMCTYDANYIKLIDKIVSYGERLKMVILLDNHFSTQGRTCGNGGWSTNQKMPDRHSLEFIKMLAKRYKNRTYVALDLHNEPHDISWDVWRNGGIIDGYRAVGMQQMLDAVRGEGFTGLVVASGAQWANDMRMIAVEPLARDKNVIYGAHVYPYWCHAKQWNMNVPYLCDGKRYNPTYDSLVQPLVGKRALMITEFSTPRAVDAEMREPIMWAEGRGLGWIAWDWCYGPAKHYCLLNNANSAEPSVLGKPVYEYLARNGR